MEVKPGYKKTDAGVIPEEWDVTQIRDVCRLINGRGFKPFEWQTVGLPIIRIQNLNGSEDFNFYLGQYNPKILVERGQLLFAWSGSRGTSFGPHVWNGGRALLNYHTWKVVVYESAVTPEFLLYALRQLTSYIEDRAHGASALVHTQKWEMEKFPLVLPRSLPEQRAIATALSDVDALLTGLTQLIAKKRDLKQAAMQQLLTGKTRLPGFSGNWEVKRLGDVAEMGSGGTPPSSVPAYYDGDIPWVSISDMTKGGKVLLSTDRNLTQAGFKNSAAQMFPEGTVLYAMYASLGECSIAGITLCSSQAILGIQPKDKLNGEFLYYFLTSLKTIVKSMGQQGTQANLNKGMVQDFQLSLPPLPEQTAIAEVLSDMDAEIAALEARLEKTRALKQGMMQELLTGRIRLV